MRLKLFILFCSLSIILAGCCPTYPKDKFNDSIVRLCKKEYKLDVKVETVGRTIAIYLPLSNLIDFTFSITKSASEKINDVILSVSRVAISTDANFDFYCVIAHDVRMPEVQIVIIKSVNDVKRFLLNDISRSEYSKRMLIDIRLAPQAQKERAVKEVFDKMRLESKWQEQVMNDFFRTEPSVLGDIGYWNNRFYIKDISLSEFLAEQIASRVRMAFRENKDFSETFTVKNSKGTYVSRPEAKYFKFEIFIEPKRFGEMKDEDIAKEAFRECVKVSVHVLRGYKFDGFDYIEIENQSDGRSIKVSRDDLERFRTKKLKIEDIVK